MPASPSAPRAFPDRLAEGRTARPQARTEAKTAMQVGTERPVAPDARSDASSLADPAPRPDERRRFKRLDTDLGARFLADRQEGTGRLRDVSAGGARVVSSAPPRRGASVVLYAERIGRLEGEVVRRTPEGFALRFTHRLGRAKRLADALTWVANRPAARDRRQARRYPQDKPARMTRADGSVLACRILDISTTGASVGVPDEHRPPIGEAIVLGLMTARIVRHHHDGIGVLFDEPQTASRAPCEGTAASPSSS